MSKKNVKPKKSFIPLKKEITNNIYEMSEKNNYLIENHNLDLNLESNKELLNNMMNSKPEWKSYINEAQNCKRLKFMMENFPTSFDLFNFYFSVKIRQSKQNKILNDQLIQSTKISKKPKFILPKKIWSFEAAQKHMDCIFEF